MKKDFTAIDNAIVRYLDGTPPVHPLSSSTLLEAALPFATSKDRWGAYRVIDRRLQALRKQGVIYHDRKAMAHWRVARDPL